MLLSGEQMCTGTETQAAAGGVYKWLVCLQLWGPMGLCQEGGCQEG